MIAMEARNHYSPALRLVLPLQPGHELCLGPLVEETSKGLLQCGNGHVLAPAAGLHRGDHGLRLRAGAGSSK